MSEKLGHQQPKPMGAPLANQNAKTHGLYVTKKDPVKSRSIGRRANHRLRGFSGELKQSMRPAMRRLLELEQRIDLMKENIETYGLTHTDGSLRGMVPELRQSEKLLLAYYEAMGMTPSSFYATRRNSLHGDVLALEKWAKGESA